jgi:hypothetical protein
MNIQSQQGSGVPDASKRLCIAALPYLQVAATGLTRSLNTFTLHTYEHSVTKCTNTLHYHLYCLQTAHESRILNKVCATESVFSRISVASTAQ